MTPILNDTSPLGTPFTLTESQRTYLQETLLEKRTGSEVLLQPQETVYLLGALTKVEAAVNGGQITLTENENRYVQEILREGEIPYQAQFERTQEELCDDVLAILEQAIKFPS